jgi:hypothetical protein
MCKIVGKIDCVQYGNVNFRANIASVFVKLM